MNQPKLPAIFDRTHLTPLLDHSVGFDRLFDSLFEDVMPAIQSATAYPPYNIKKIGDTRIIELALAGYSEADLSVELDANVLTITGDKDIPTTAEEVIETTVEFLHKGIAARKFKRTYQLADNTKVTDASFVDGILSVTVELVQPKAKAAKKIAING